MKLIHKMYTCIIVGITFVSLSAYMADIKFGIFVTGASFFVVAAMFAAYEGDRDE